VYTGQFKMKYTIPAINNEIFIHFTLMPNKAAGS
jgi:hypothetical protein